MLSFINSFWQLPESRDVDGQKAFIRPHFANGGPPPHWIPFLTNYDDNEQVGDDAAAEEEEEGDAIVNC